MVGIKTISTFDIKVDIALEPKFGQFLTLQRVSSVVSEYVINWREVNVHKEDISDTDTDTVKIAVVTNLNN